MIENTQVNASDILSMQNRLAAYLTTYLPGVNLQPGSAMYDIVVKAFSHVLVLVEKEAQEARSRYNIVQLAANEDTTSRLMLEDALSNWFIERRRGGIATVLITIETSIPVEVALTSSTEFSRGELVSFIPVSSARRTYSTDAYSTYISSAGTTIYYFRFLAESTNPGIGANLPAGDFVPSTSIPGFLRAYSTSSSSSAASFESNSELVGRAKDSLSSRGFNSRKSILATINDLGISSVINIVTVRAGDREMQRDLLNSNFELYSDIHVLGKSDIVVATTKGFNDTSAVSTAPNSYLDLSTAGGVGALYYVYSVRQSGSNLVKVDFQDIELLDGTKVYLKTARSIDDSNGRITVVQSLVNSKTLANSEYTVQYPSSTRGKVLDSVRVLLPEPKSNIVIEYISSSGLDIIEAALNDESLKPLGTSLSTKLAIPIELSKVTIKYTPNSASPLEAVPESLIRSSVAEFVNSYKGLLTTSDIRNYIANSFFQFISYVDPDIEVQYNVTLPSIGTLYYSTSTNSALSIEKVYNQSIPSIPNKKYSTVLSLEDLLRLEASDRVVTYYTNRDLITMELA